MMGSIFGMKKTNDQFLNTMSFPSVPNEFIYLINQVFDMERKVAKLTESNSLARNLDRIKNKFQDLGLEMANPLGESYDETRTDCEANIAGSSTDNLVITDVIKPIVRLRQGDSSLIVQKAVVIVESKS